jgi:hypothetical protein
LESQEKLLKAYKELLRLRRRRRRGRLLWPRLKRP